VGGCGAVIGLAADPADAEGPQQDPVSAAADASSRHDMSEFMQQHYREQRHVLENVPRQ
jgi:hypothetical protein